MLKLFKVNLIVLFLFIEAAYAEPSIWVENVKITNIFLGDYYFDNGDPANGDSSHGGVFIEVDNDIGDSYCGSTNRNRFFMNLKMPREQLWFSALLSAYHAKTEISIELSGVCGPWNFPMINQLKLLPH